MKMFVSKSSENITDDKGNPTSIWAKKNLGKNGKPKFKHCTKHVKLYIRDMARSDRMKAAKLKKNKNA